MRGYTRRQFLTQTLIGAGLTAGAPALLRSADKGREVLEAKDVVTLGRTNIKVSSLAQGTGFNGSARSSAHTRMGEKAFDELVRHSLDSGVNFLDMADLYGSHAFVKNVVKGLPRDKYVLLSKIWVRKEDWVQPSGGATEEVNRFCRELGVERLDICLIHCATDSRWTDAYAKVRDELSKLKQQGMVRAVGVSCHDLGALKTAAEHPWVDVIFARINHKGGNDYAMDGTVEEVSAVLKQARKNGKAVVGMKIFGAGKLVKPEEKDTSLKYVWQNGLVDAVTIGMLKREEVDDTIPRLKRARRA